MKMKKRVITIFISLILIISSMNIAFAGDDITNGITISNSKTNEFADVGNTIFSIIRVVGIIASVIALMLIGIKYMLGSVEEKAAYKKTFPIYIIGCVLVFATCSLANVLYDFLK